MNSKKLNNFVALVLALVLSVGLLPVQASAATVKFDDVPAGIWYETYVNTLAEKGVVSGVGAIKGVGNNCFNPNGNVAYAEMTKMVVNAFFRSEFSAYEAANASTMRNYFGNNLYWFSYMCYFGNANGLLDGITLDIRNHAACTAPMTRYDMGRVLYNALKLKGITVSEDDKGVARAKLMGISHYYDIPEAYRDIVVTVYASGLINGKGDDGFCGNDKMTRAEACKVIVILDELVTKGGNGGGTTDPDPIPTPDVPSGPKDIQVTTNTNATLTNIAGGPYRGTAYNVADNGFGNGKTQQRQGNQRNQHH